MILAPPIERFPAFRRTLSRTPRLHRQTVRVRGLRFAVFSSPPVAAPTVPNPEIHETHARAIYRALFGNREMADSFTPPRSVSLTGAAVAARVRREGYDWRPILSALSAPALVFHGTEDALPVRVGEELAELIPQARPHALLGGVGGVLPRRRVVPRRPNPGSRRSAAVTL